MKNNKIKRVAVFCASSDNINDVYISEAQKLGKLLAQNNITCYTGGGYNGLMRHVQKSILENNGKCVGVIPTFMIKNKWLDLELSKVIEVDSMTERKSILRYNTDMIIVLPGGIGTLDEMFEAVALRQLDVLKSPVFLININGYFDKLLEFISQSAEENFISNKNISDLFNVVENVSELPLV